MQFRTQVTVVNQTVNPSQKTTKKADRLRWAWILADRLKITESEVLFVDKDFLRLVVVC